MQKQPLIIGIFLLFLVVGCSRGTSTNEEPTATPQVETPATLLPTEPPSPTDQPTVTVPALATETAEVVVEPTIVTELHSFAIVPEQSEAIYRASEEFFGRAIETHAPFVKPVGTTNDIEGTITLDLSGDVPIIEAGTIHVNLKSLQSDDERRDKKIQQEYLQSNLFPTATFTLKEVAYFTTDWREGRPVTFDLIGDLAIREETVHTTFDVTARLEDGIIKGTAVTTLLMTDFGFYPPDLYNFVIVGNGVEVTLNFTAEAQ